MIKAYALVQHHPSGTPQRMIGVSFDISDFYNELNLRKQAEAELLKINTVMQNAVEGVSRLDINGHYLFVNPAYANMCGYTPDEMVGMMWQRTVNPQDIAIVETAYQKMLKTGKVEAEARGIRKDSTVFYKQLTMISTYDEQGEFIGHHCFMKDVSERKHLEEQQHRLIAILEASTDYIGMSDAAGNILWNNREFRRLWELDDHAVFCHKYIHDYHPQWVAELIFKQGLPTAIANGTWMGETALLNAKGEEIPTSQLIIAHKSPQGEVEFFSTILRDMRIRKEYEQRLELSNAELTRATRLKSEFLANMSHELRTPLNAILGLSEGLQEEIFGVLNERQKQFISTIERSGRHLLELINDILDVSKIEAGKLELEMDSVSVIPLCKSSLSFVKQQATRKNIQLKTSVPNDLEEIIVDERRMRQVLINLLSNAVKFTPSGGQVILDVHLEPLCISVDDPNSPSSDAHPHYSLCFSVIDTGIGIAPTDINKLFQPFIQIDSSLNRKYAGTGLGLTLVKQIVEMHGATISVSSELNQGSCFTVRLPYICKRNVPSKPRTDFSPGVVQLAHTETIAASKSVIKPPVILLAEDNLVNVNTFCAYLEARGYELIVAKNGQEAINLAITQTPNLILMDIQMPEIDGLEAIRQIRAHPELASIPIIAVTALAMLGDEKKCLEAGANKYFSKPVKLKQLAETIRELLPPFIN